MKQIKLTPSKLEAIRHALADTRLCLCDVDRENENDFHDDQISTSKKLEKFIQKKLARAALLSPREKASGGNSK